MRKLVRDFIPGLLAIDGPLKGTVETAHRSERLLLGARKVAADANALLAAIEERLSRKGLHTEPGHATLSRIITHELGDVYEALLYTASELKMDMQHAASRNRERRGGFTRHFVWDDRLQLTDHDSVAALELPAAIQKALNDAAIWRLGELCAWRERDLLQIRRVGSKTIEIIKEHLAAHHRHLRDN